MRLHQSRSLLVICALLAATLAAGCSGALGPLPCGGDDQCPTDWYCAKAQGAAQGTCSANPACPADHPSSCSGTCFNLSTDTGHCGTCDNACTAPTGGGSTSCVSGACAPSCPSGSKLVSGACVPPPAAPTGLTAAGGAGQITVTWPAVTGATSYELRRGTAAGGPYGTSLGAAVTSPYVDQGLTAGARYYYVLLATGPGGTSAASAEASAITAPPAPTGLTATGGAGQAVLVWSRASGAGSYNVYGGVAGSEALLTGLSPVGDPGAGATATVTETGLPDGLRRSYVIEAVNASGKTKGAAASAVTTLPAPANVLATPSLSGVALDWTGPVAATSYSVSVSVDGGATWSPLGAVTAKHFDDTTAAQATAYVFQVVAATADATSAPATSNAVTTPLSMPANVAATVASSTALAVTWSKVTAATGYDVYRQTGGAGAFTHVGPQPSVAAAACCIFTDSSVQPGQGYAYELVAVSGLVSSATTTPVSSAALLATPVLGAPSAVSTKVVLGWTAIPGAAGYEVLRSTDGSTFSLVGQNRPTVSGGSVITYSDIAVSPGASYFYKLEAWTAFTTSAPSAQVQAVTPLDAPTGLAVVGSPNPGAVTLTWTASPGATSYLIEAAAGSGAFLTAGTSLTNGFTDTAAIGATTYTYRVTAKTAVASSPPSGTVQAVVPLLTPAWLAADPARGAIVWPASSGATGFNIQHSSDGVTFTPVNGTTPSVPASAACSGGTCSFAESGLALLSTEYYQVQAYSRDTSGGVLTSGFSPIASLTTTAVPPPDVSKVSVATTATDVTLTWQPVSGVSAYTVRRAPSPGGPWTVAGGFVASAFSPFTDPALPAGAPCGTSGQSCWYYTIQSAVSDAMVSVQTAPITATLQAATLSAPTAVSAGYDANYQVNVSWTPAGVPANVYYSQDGGVTWLSNGASSAITGVIGPLLVGVQLVSGSPASAWSKLVTASLTVPNPPQGVVSGLGVVAGTGPSSGLPQNVLTWNAVAGATQYVVNVSTNGTAYSGRATVASGTTTYTDASATLLAGTPYYYSVRANFPGSVAGPLSSGVRVVTTLPGAPTGLAVGNTNKGSAQLSWTAVSGMPTNGGYNVLRSLDGANFVQLGASPTVPGSSTTFTDSTLTGAGAAQTFFYKVQAWTPSVPGGGPLSAAVSNSFPVANGTLAAPTGLSATLVSATSVTLNWTGSSSVAGFNVLRSTDGGAFTVLGSSQPTVTGATFRYVDATAFGGQPFVYRVQAVLSAGAGLGYPSAPLSVVTPVSGLLAAGGPTQAVLAWSPAAGATQYSVYRNAAPGLGATGTALAQTPHNSYADLGAPAGVSYYVVTATYAGGQTGPASAEAAASVGAGGVGGTKTVTHWTYSASGGYRSAVTPVDLTNGCQTCVQLLAGYQQAGTWTQSTVVGSWDGNFAIANVPQQQFVVGQVPLPPSQVVNYYVTSARTLDLGTDDFGRADEAAITLSPSYLSITSSGLAPFNPLDLLITFGANSAHTIYGITGGPGTPEPGATSLTNLTVDSFLSAGRKLLDGTKGDDLALYQLGTVQVKDASGVSVPVQTTVRYGNAVSVPAQADGQPSSVTIPLATPSTTVKLTTRFKRSAFASLFSQSNPATVTSPTAADFLYLDASPGGGAGLGNFGAAGSPDLLIVSPPLQEVQQDLNLGDQTVGSPWPAAWPVFCMAYVGTATPVVMPGAKGVRDFFVYYNLSDTLANCNAMAQAGGIAPRLGPVQSLQINGLDATLEQDTVGVTPTLSWKAPKLGVADYYSAQIYKVVRSGLNTTYTRVAVAVTTDTQMALPPGILVSGAGFAYFAQVSAQRHPGFSMLRPSRTSSLTTDTTPAVTAKFFPTAPAAACVPKTCAQAGANCGSPPDGCGGVLTSCGVCTSPQSCSASFVCQ